MAKKYDFRPDPEGSGDFGKLLLTRQQRRSLARWSLYAAVCILALLLAWLGAALLLFFSGKLLGYLGEKGTVALTRLMGTVLVMIAVQMVLNGIIEYLKVS